MMINSKWTSVEGVLIILFSYILTAFSETYNLGFLPAITVGKGKKYAGAFVYALNRTNNDSSILHGHTLDYFYRDNQADPMVTIRAMTEMYMNNTVAYIGPEDTCTTEAQLAGAWNIPMIAFKCTDSKLSNKKLYPTFARTLPSTSKVSKSVIALMKQFRWSTFTMVVGKTNWQETSTTLNTLAQQNGIHIMSVEYFREPYSDTYHDILKQIVMRTRARTRVYVFLGDEHAMIDFVRIMERLGLNRKGEYVVIAVRNSPFDPAKAKKSEYLLKVPFEENVSVLSLHAFRPLLLLMERQPQNPNYEQFIEETRKYSSAEPFNAPLLSLPTLKQNIKLPVPIYAAHLYDAVAIYARAAGEILLNNGTFQDVRDGRAIFNRIKSRKFRSIQGHDIFIDENGDAEGNYSVFALKHDADSDYQYSLQEVGNFTMTEHGLGIPKFRYSDKIDWISGSVPPSEPECGFDGNKCNFYADWTTATICSISAAAVLIAAVFACRHYLYEQKLASLLWKIDYKDLVMTEPACDSTPLEKSKPGKCRLYHRPSLPGEGFALPPSSQLFSWRSIRIGSYKGSLVAIKHLKKNIEVNRGIKKELQLMKELHHDNINRFVGACIDPPHLYLVTHYCARRSLQDILENDDLRLDDMFIASLVADLIKGLTYLHDSEVLSHGNLTSSNCLVDSRWVLQIADFGLNQLKTQDNPEMLDEKYYKRRLVRAPELLRDPCAPRRGSQRGDVYSFAFILYEIHGRAGPWGNINLAPHEIIEKVKYPESDNAVFRPNTSTLTCADFIIKCMTECWTEEPDQRPDMKYVRIKLKQMQTGLRSNIFDNMLAMMEKYANNLEGLVAERTDQLMEEKKKTEALLLRMLPKSVAETLKQGRSVIPEHYDRVTIYFSDIVDFTKLSAESTPMQVVDMLNDLYTLFDSIIGEYQVYKVETIGDAYMVVSGLPIRNANNHAGEIASMSLHLLRAIKNFKIRHKNDETLKLRIGVHSGSCVAGVVGLKMPRYCLFGDTVNTASRMESSGCALKIHCSSECKHILDKLGGYMLQPRGLISMKGKGEKFTYFLVGEDKSQRFRRISSDRGLHYKIDRNVTFNADAMRPNSPIMCNTSSDEEVTVGLSANELQPLLSRDLRTSGECGEKMELPLQVHKNTAQRPKTFGFAKHMPKELACRHSAPPSYDIGNIILNGTTVKEGMRKVDEHMV